MLIIKQAIKLKEYIQYSREQALSIGFVPTMGALHRGHMSLIEASRNRTGFTVCSIFVNPTQFNNPEDLKKYPQTIERDIEMLESAGCNLLFLPELEDIYPKGYQPPHYELGYLETILEGKHRPGHFQGVCQVVDILLNLTTPDVLFLGEKDFQQCLVLKRLLDVRKNNIELAICNTIREKDGLAMSSRNMRLNEDERKKAAFVYKILTEIKETLLPGETHEIISKVTDRLNKEGFKTDYVEIADYDNLQPLANWDGKTGAIALIAAFLGEIRLIDNMRLF